MATDISARANRSGSWTSLWRGALMALATADHDGGFVAKALERYLSFGNTESGRAADYARADLDRRIDRHKAREAIPRAWTHLVENDPEQRLAGLLVEATSKLADTAPSMEDVSGFVRRLRPDIPRMRESRKTRMPAPKAPSPMTTVVHPTERAGESQVRYCLFGSYHVARNAKEAYIAIFRCLADRDLAFFLASSRGSEGARIEELPQRSKSYPRSTR